MDREGRPADLRAAFIFWVGGGCAEARRTRNAESGRADDDGIVPIGPGGVG
jgi:hypothetical protein